MKRPSEIEATCVFVVLPQVSAPTGWISPPGQSESKRDLLSTALTLSTAVLDGRVLGGSRPAQWRRPTVLTVLPVLPVLTVGVERFRGKCLFLTDLSDLSHLFDLSDLSG